MKVLHESLAHDLDRYAFDFQACTSEAGWAQIDTEQDASYFGQWLQPWDRKVCSFIEGEVRVVQAESDAELREYLENLVRWNVDMGYKPAKIDPGLSRRAEFVERLEALGVGGMVH